MTAEHLPSTIVAAAVVPPPPAASAASSDLCTTHSTALRKHQGTHGLLPPAVETYAVQAQRCLAQLEAQPTPLAKYCYLSQLRQANAHLFYRLAVDHMKTLTPLIYTPVVGEACQRWSDIFVAPEGLYLSWADKGRIAEVLANWPQPNVEITVVTDGSRILGLGDLGINGMGIPIGKLALYSACGGIRPSATLPLTVDLGTSNTALHTDPLYLGSRRHKVTPAEEAAFLDELMEALVHRWPGIVIQFEDWKNPFPSLERYQPRYSMFNDDIQGTGAVILGGMINAVKSAGVPIREHRAVVMGAGSAAVGVAKQIVAFFMTQGLTEDEARRCFYLVDTKGMVTLDRGDKLADHKVYFARDDNDGAQFADLPAVVSHVRPTILLGLSTIGGCFTPTILQQMASHTTHPIVFPLSNPSASSECDFDAAFTHTAGRVLFASGSPFPPITDAAGTEHVPGQGNNMYVFPGIGLAAILCRAATITQEMIYASGAALAASLTDAERARGWLYPDLARIRDVSIEVAAGVIHAALRAGVDRAPAARTAAEGGEAELRRWIRAHMYDPHDETQAGERDLKERWSGHAITEAASERRAHL